PGVFPTVAGDFVGASDATGGEHHRFGPEQSETPALALVTERAHHAVAVFQQPGDRAFHVDVDAHVNAVVLQSPDHLQARAIADVRQSRVAVAAKISLENAAVLRAIEERAPGLELAYSIGRFLRVQLRHP